MKRVNVFVVLVLVVGLGWVYGFTGNLAKHQVLCVAFMAADLKTLDPHFASGTQDRWPVDMIFNALIRCNPGIYRGF